MAKRTAENQITKDDYNDDDFDDRHGPVEPPVMASSAVMAGRKIAKPKSRVGLKPGSLNTPTESPASKGAQPPSQTGLFGSAFSQIDGGAKSNPFGSILSSNTQFSASTPSTPFANLSKPNPVQGFSAAAPAAQSKGFSFQPSASAAPKTGFQTTLGNMFGSPAKPPVFSAIPTFISDDRDMDSTEPEPKGQKEAVGSSGTPSSTSNLFAMASKPSFQSSQLASSATAGSNIFGNGAATAAAPKLFASQPSQPAASKLNAVPAKSSVPDVSLDKVPMKIHDPKSLVPPTHSKLDKAQMPEFNFLFQVRSLNTEFVKQVNLSFEKNPSADLSQLLDSYTAKIKEYDTALSRQRSQIEGGNGSSIGGGQNQDAPSLYPKLPAESGNAAEKAPNVPTINFGSSSSATNAFGGGASIFSSSTQKENVQADNKTPANPFESKPQPSSSIFSTTPKQPETGVFGSAQKPQLLKPSATQSFFNFNSNTSSTAPSNAASPGGSVLDGGTAGMSSGNDGGWANPFTKDNPMFMTGGSDGDDDEEDDDEDQGGHSKDVGQSLRGAAGNNQIQSTTPIKQSATAGLFGSTKQTPTDKDFRWTPDKPITFGQANTSTTSAKTDSASSASAFGGTSSGFTGLFGGAVAPKAGAEQTGSTTSSGLFGSNAANTSAASGSIFGNLASKPSNSGSIFNFGGAAPKPNDGKSLFGAGPAKGLGGSSIFASLNSPAPSGLSTPGESSEKNASGNEGAGGGGGGAGGDDSNEPSDEAGQGANNTSVDLSGAGPGEEDEDAVFDVRSSIYNLDNKKYNKVGVGRLRVLHNRINGKGRVVVKMETGKLLMNVALRKDMNYNTVGPGEADKVVKILEVVQGQQAPKVWVMKVGKAEDAAALRKCMQENKG